MFIKCKICNKSFKTYKSQVEKYNKRFCSISCFSSYRRKFIRGESHPLWKGIISKKCPICKKEFTFKVCRKNIRKTCSYKCAKKYFSITYFGENATRKKIKGTRKCWGYIYQFSPNHPLCNKRGYVMQHRLVMENKIGRILSRKEVVHHINKIKDDNRQENLMLFKDNTEHMKYHRIHGRTSLPIPFPLKK